MDRDGGYSASFGRLNAKNTAKMDDKSRKEHPMKNLKISAGTIARTAVLALALTNQLLSAAGKPVLPVESAQLEQLVSAGLTVAASLWGWWKNNSFTQAALQADERLKELKNK